MRVLVAFFSAAVLIAGSSRSNAVTIDFTGLTNIRTANGEVNGTEFNSQGLDLTTTGIAFNVGCGPAPTTPRCLSADAIQLNDFDGTITGQFVVPGTHIDAMVDSLTISFCCGTGISNPGTTITELFNASGDPIFTLAESDVSFEGSTFGTFTSSFRIRLGFDGIYSIAYRQIFPVPEPSTALLIALGLAAISVCPTALRG